MEHRLESAADLRSIVHELRNAINAMVTSGTCLLDDHLDEQQRVRLGRLMASGADDARRQLAQLQALIDGD